MRNNVPTILCLLTMLGFALMFVQTQWKPFKLEPLKGFTPVVEKPELTFGTLLKTCFTDAFARWDYWEYNKTVISSNPDYNFAKVVDLVDSYKVLEEADVVMAVFTAPMLYDYMFGFAETAFDLYEFARCDSCVKERKIQWMMTVIQSSPEWYDAVVKQAEENGIPIEEVLRGNAEYTLYKRSQSTYEE